MSRLSLYPFPATLGLSAALLLTPACLMAQTAAPATTDNGQAQSAPATPGKQPKESKKQLKKENKVVASKDTKKADKKAKKTNPLAGMDEKLPDKQLFDKAMLAMQKNHFDVARLDLQTLLNTYPDSQYQMRAKLAIGDSWYKEGGTASLTQAEQEYKDFITFFPNQPEAAEAQMKVANIYFREMDRPDRDYTKALRAQEEYRNMIQQFPESSLIPEAKQKLREVQEVLGVREENIAGFYASHMNYSASIARYRTIADTYPLYSHMDDVLLGLGDAYASQARLVSGMNLPEGPKGRLMKIYNDQAAAAYGRLVTVYPLAAHVEVAKEKLQALGYKVPTPTAEQLEASEALENSRAPYTLTRRAKLLVVHTPDTVSAAHVGEPTMADPAVTTAPQIVHQDIADLQGVTNPNSTGTGPVPGGTGYVDASAATADNNSADMTASEPTTVNEAQPVLQDVPTGEGAATSGASISNVPTSGAALGAEVVKSGQATGSTTFPGDTGANAALPPVEKAADAPDTINDAAGSKQPVADGSKPVYDKSSESSNKHKKKSKLNPF